MIENRIKALIQEKGLTQKAVAEKAGYTENAFSRIVSGRAVIKDSDVYAVAQALEVTPNALYEIADHDERSRRITVRLVTPDNEEITSFDYRP